MPNIEVKLLSADGSRTDVPLKWVARQYNVESSSAGRASALQAEGSAVRTRHSPPFKSRPSSVVEQLTCNQ